MTSKRKPETDAEMQSSQKKAKNSTSVTLNADTWCHISSFLPAHGHAMLARVSTVFRANSKRPNSWCPDVYVWTEDGMSAPMLHGLGLRTPSFYSTDQISDAMRAAVLFNASLTNLTVEESKVAEVVVRGDISTMFLSAPNLRELNIDTELPEDEFGPCFSLLGLEQTHPELRILGIAPAYPNFVPALAHLRELILETNVALLSFSLTGLPSLERITLVDRVPPGHRQVLHEPILQHSQLPKLRHVEFSFVREMKRNRNEYKACDMSLFDQEIGAQLEHVEIRMGTGPPLYPDLEIFTLGSTFINAKVIHLDGVFDQLLHLKPFKCKALQFLVTNSIFDGRRWALQIPDCQVITVESTERAWQFTNHLKDCAHFAPAVIVVRERADDSDNEEEW